jgi:hypothetical protein
MSFRFYTRIFTQLVRSPLMHKTHGQNIQILNVVELKMVTLHRQPLDSDYLSMHSWPSPPIFLPIAIFLCLFVPPFWVSLSMLYARKLVLLKSLFLNKKIIQIDSIIPHNFHIARCLLHCMGGGGGGGGGCGGIGSGGGSGSDGGDGGGSHGHGSNVRVPGNPVLFCSAICAQHPKWQRKVRANGKMAKKSKYEWKNRQQTLVSDRLVLQQRVLHMYPDSPFCCCLRQV